MLRCYIIACDAWYTHLEEIRVSDGEKNIQVCYIYLISTFSFSIMCMQPLPNVLYNIVNYLY